MSSSSKKNSKATEQALEALHGALADTLATGLREIQKAMSEEGGEVKGAAALLNVARQYLKDNGIEAMATPENPIGNLVDSLPFTPADSESDHQYRH